LKCINFDVLKFQKFRVLQPPSSEALIMMKTIVGVHVLTGYAEIATHMTCRSTMGILAKKRPSGRITTLVPIKQKMVRNQQVIQRFPFT
jgi:hypothetical protein